MSKFLKARVIIIIIGVLFSAILARNIFTLLSVEDRLSDLKQKIAKEEKDKEELLRLEKNINSEFFIEKEARERLGLAKSGETIVVLPSGEYLRSLVLPLDEDNTPRDMPNWKKWLELLF